MRSLLTTVLVPSLLLLLPGVTVAAEPTPTWGAPFVTVPDAPAETASPAAGETVRVPANAPPELKPSKLRKGLTRRQRREMGLTFRNVGRVLIVIQEENGGSLSEFTREELAVIVFDHLVDGSPQAFGDPSIDWDAILAFIERLLPLILKIIALFS